MCIRDSDYSDSVAEQIDDEVHSLIEGAYQTAMRILKENRPRLDNVSNYLMENETIEEDQFPDIFDNLPVAAPMPAD